MKFDIKDADIAWCPGCGDFLILNILKSALEELKLSPEDIVTCSGIGQAAKIPHYFKTNFFNGLHGRALPAAVAIKVSNPELNVLAISGDGDMYGEGGNHFISTIRRNPNITNIVHNNMVYGLTKGQASPSSMRSFVTPIQHEGVFNEPFNPLATAIAQGATFIARAYCGDKDKTKEIFKKAIQHKGYALVDVFQPCVTYNKLNTYEWFKNNTYYLEDSYVPNDKIKAFERSLESDKLPLGIFYVDTNRPTFEESACNKNISSIAAFDRRKSRTKKLQEMVLSYK